MARKKWIPKSFRLWSLSAKGSMYLDKKDNVYRYSHKRNMLTNIKTGERIKVKSII